MNKNELKDFIEDVLPLDTRVCCIELKFYCQPADVDASVAAIRQHVRTFGNEADFSISVDPLNGTVTVLAASHD